jgi:hypothetical protein
MVPKTTRIKMLDFVCPVEEFFRTVVVGVSIFD